MPQWGRLSEWLGVAWPHVGLLFKIRALRSNHTEPLPRWRFHDPPSIQLLDPPGTESFKSGCFCLDIIRFDVEMNSAFVPHRLNKDFHLT